MISVYVTTPFENTEDAAQVMKRLRASKYHIAVDWTKRRLPCLSMKTRLRNYKKEIRAVAKCDVLVLLAPKKDMKYIQVTHELAIAHALKKPIVIVTPFPDILDTSFYTPILHLGTKYIPSVDKLVDYLKRRFR